MASAVLSLLQKMTPEEQTEVETFAAFLLVRRNLKKVQVLTDDISIQEMTRLVERAGTFEWLSSDEEDVYSFDEGDEAQWESES